MTPASSGTWRLLEGGCQIKLRDLLGPPPQGGLHLLPPYFLELPAAVFSAAQVVGFLLFLDTQFSYFTTGNWCFCITDLGTRPSCVPRSHTGKCHGRVLHTKGSQSHHRVFLMGGASSSHNNRRIYEPQGMARLGKASHHPCLMGWGDSDEAWKAGAF